MRAWLLVALLLAPALSGCIGTDGGETTAPTAASNGSTDAPDFSRLAGADDATVPVTRQPLDADPLSPGSWNVTRSHYDLGWTVVENSANPQTYPARLNGSVHYPESGEGPFPVVVVQHGRHSTCTVAQTTRAGPTGGPHACPDARPATDSVDNYRGYNYLAETLASHGYVVASVNANQVNDRDEPTGFADDFAEAITGQDVPKTGDAGAQARAQLVLRTLDGLESLDAGDDPGSPVADNGDLATALEGRLAMDRVGLLGHSRGGEGVTYAVEYNEARAQGDAHDLQAVFALAPIDVNDVTAPGVAFATLLPYCDGDVWGLSGADIYDDTRYVDDAGPAYQFVVMGSNHNFYNTLWEEHFDDAGWIEDDFCGAQRSDGGGRLSPADQRRHGEALVNAFFRAHLGGEERYEAFLEGATLPPASACPGGQAPCAGLVYTSYMPPAGDRLVLDAASRDHNASLDPVLTLAGFDGTTECGASCTEAVEPGTAERRMLDYTGPATYGFELREPVDVTGYEALTLRGVANPLHEAVEPGERVQPVVEVEDAGGNRSTLDTATHADGFLAPHQAADEDEDRDHKLVVSQLRVPLDALEGVDREQVRSIQFAFGPSAGSVVVTDAMLVR